MTREPAVPSRGNPFVTPQAAPGVLHHCRRTAAIAKLIAHHLFLPTEEKAVLFAACLLHHSIAGLLAPQAMQRLLADVLGEEAPPVGDLIPGTVRKVLDACQVPGSGT